MACHNGLTARSGEDVSLGFDWRATMMANSARDPHWQAAVRRETLDHPLVAEEIEHECSVCHMPMAHTLSVASGAKGRVFAHLSANRKPKAIDRLAVDGVSCSLCHQIAPRNLGTRQSFTGGFEIDGREPSGDAAIFGPFNVDRGRTTIMRSATGFRQTESRHIQESELCATCHTLYTNARGAKGEIVGRLPEQVPYLEWRHSAFREQQSCQSCHMPVVEEPTPIVSVLGEPRDGLSRHVFLGGNFFMLRMLNRYRAELGVRALPQELDAAATRTIHHLQSKTANVTVDGMRVEKGRLDFRVTATNLSGHKLPTAYPSRRAWLHVTVRDGSGRTLFESGAVRANGFIDGNDNDADRARYEPHHRLIRTSQEVQVYEAIIEDPAGIVTTGLLQGVRFAKDNRLLPSGFDKATAEPDIAVRGDAAVDEDFAAGSDRTGYSIDISQGAGPYAVDVELRFQPIAFRWADNLRQYTADETHRFVTYYESMGASSSEVLTRTTVISQP